MVVAKWGKRGYYWENMALSRWDRFSEKVDNGFSTIGRNWLFWFHFIVGLYTILPIIAPLLMQAGWTRPASLLYRLYSPTCHQMAFRSIFVGGEQWVYPREIASLTTRLTPFETYAKSLTEFEGVPMQGLSADLIITSRRFVGNQLMGYKTAICQRDLMIFGSLFVGGLTFTAARRRGPVRIPKWLSIVIGLLAITPIAFDGFSQLFGYYADLFSFLRFIPMRESPPYLRMLTGAWFGFCVAWLILPLLDNNK